jgi:hypothetical protein
MITFTYRLKGAGWAYATIANEQNETTIRASYIRDALGDFVNAVLSLTVTTTAQCFWEEEPAVIRWEFRRDGPSMALKAYRDNNALEIFAGEDDFLHFSSELDRALDALLREWGPERYLEQWRRYPFPQESHAKLKQAIRLEQEDRQLRK